MAWWSLFVASTPLCPHSIFPQKLGGPHFACFGTMRINFEQTEPSPSTFLLFQGNASLCLHLHHGHGETMAREDDIGLPSGFTFISLYSFENFPLSRSTIRSCKVSPFINLLPDNLRSWATPVIAWYEKLSTTFCTIIFSRSPWDKNGKMKSFPASLNHLTWSWLVDQESLF